MKTKRALLLLLLAAGCGDKSQAQPPGGGKSRAGLKFPVETQVVESRRVEYSISSVGTVDAHERVQVTARVGGAVDKVLFNEGDQVKQDQPLAEIEARRYQIAALSAKAVVAKAQSALTDAKAGLLRREKAVEQSPGLITGEEIETFRARVQAGEADVAAARAALQLAELNQRDAYVRAPVAGIIETRTVQTGQYLQPGAVLATMVQRDPLLVRFRVPVSDAQKLRTGMPVRFRVRSDEKENGARITHVGGAADEASRLVLVTATIDDGAARALSPGAFAEVSVPVGAATDAPVIPQTAVRPSEKGFLAYVVEKDVAQERVLELGMRTADGRVEVRRGVSPGEQLVVRGGEALRDGAPVRVAGKPEAGAKAADAAPPPGEGDAPMNITEVCIRKPVFAWMLMAATVLFGGVALSRIGISQFPDVDNPSINISFTREGAAPEVMEHDVIEIVEEAVLQVEGVQSIQSSAGQGSANVNVELALERNVDVAMQDVQARVSQVQSRLPRDMDPAVVSKSNPEDQPIMWIGLSGPFSRQILADYARYRVKASMQTVPGVGEVRMGGYLERNVRIWVNANKLDELHVTVGDIKSALLRQHVELPAGQLEAQGREINVRVLGEALDLDTLRKLVVRDEGDSPVYLEDVALVEDGFEDERRLSRVNGQPAQGMGIRKQRGANAVAVAQGIRQKIADLKETMPEGMELAVNFDSTSFIEESVNEIKFELLLAIGLTALVCWMFLGSLSSTLNVVLAIPMSLLGTVAVIYFAGFTLNTFTLLALSLAVGIVVDDAIMVLENIFRHAESGKDRVRAAREGTSEITFAALAATLAVCAIFLPVVFMKGVVGRFFMQFGITLSVAVLLSYLEAITLAPARSAQILKVSRHDRSGLGRLVDRGFDALSRVYERLLARALRWPKSVLALGAGLFAMSLIILLTLPTEFVPSQDQSRLMVRLTTAVGSDLPETDKLVRKAEDILLKRPEIERIFGFAGAFGGGGGGGGGVNGGTLFVTMKPPGERKLSQAQVQAELRRDLNAIPGLRAFPQDLSQSGFVASRGYPVEFSVRGPDWEKLIEESMKLKEKLEATGVVADLDSDYKIGMPELRIVPDRARAADVGVNIEDIASTLNSLIGGERVGKYSSNGRRVDVRLRLLESQRRRPEDIAGLHVRNTRGDLIPLSSLITQEERPALQSITRRDLERAITFTANVAPGHSQGEALKVIGELGKTLPTGYHAVPGGASVTFTDAITSLIFALIMGVMVAYMVLASQFNSFLHPVTVLTILPLSFVGAALALLIAGYTLNIFSMIGLLLLMGIVKKNSIILVDYANQMRAEGNLGAADAMRKAGPVRLRPILMTSVATMMAALPSALHLGPGAEIRAPMALAVIGGLVVSTALSLLVVPAFYVVADSIVGRLRKRPVTVTEQPVAPH